MTVSLRYKSNCTLGEGAFWHEARQSFFWVDITGQTLFEIDGHGTVASWKLSHPVSLIAQDRHEDCLILALQGRIIRFNLKTKHESVLVELESDKPDNRSNDGAVDSRGRLWIGTMNMQFKSGAGALYCVHTDLSVQKKVSGLTIPNGLAWTKDETRMYHVDSATRQVASYRFNPESSEISFEKIALQIPEEMGAPDGMCLDEEDMLWIAHWDGFGVFRWNPNTGRLLDKIAIPVPQVSSCAFGGKNFDQLFITTARQNLSPEELEKYPDCGSVYQADAGVRGVPKHVFHG